MGQTLFTLTCLWNSQTAGVHSMGVWRHVTATFSQCIKSLPRNRMCVWILVRQQGKMGKINELSSYKIVFGSAFKVSIPGWDFSLQKYFPPVNAEKKLWVILMVLIFKETNNLCVFKNIICQQQNTVKQLSLLTFKTQIKHYLFAHTCRWKKSLASNK